MKKTLKCKMNVPDPVLEAHTLSHRSRSLPGGKVRVAYSKAITHSYPASAIPYHTIKLKAGLWRGKKHARLKYLISNGAFSVILETKKRKKKTS